MAIHYRLPRGENVADVNPDIGFFTVLRDVIEKQIPYSMNWRVFQPLKTAIACETAGVAHQFSSHGVIRMLIFLRVRREDNLRPEPSDLRRDSKCIFRLV